MAYTYKSIFEETPYMEITYRIYKNNKDTERTVTIYYKHGDQADRERKIANLKADYPMSKGYFLMKEHERRQKILTI